MGRVRITRPFVLLALAALLAPRIEASRTSVWDRNPPATFDLTKAEAASALASLTPAEVADVDGAELPRFDLGDIVLVEREIEHEERFDLGPLTLVDLNLLRGPPSSYPETRVRGFELLPPFRVEASPTLSLWPRQACGFSCREVASDSRYDPWGLQGEGDATGWLYHFEAYVDGKPVAYDGSTMQEIRKRFSKHKWKELLRAKTTYITRKPTFAEPDVAASGRGTLRSAKTEALRGPEELEMRKTREKVARYNSKLKAGQKPAEILNEIGAAEEPEALIERHKVTTGRTTVVQKGAGKILPGVFILQTGWDAYKMSVEQERQRFGWTPYTLDDEFGEFTFGQEDTCDLCPPKYSKSYVSGKRQGQVEPLTSEQYREYRSEAESLFGKMDPFTGKLVPGKLPLQAPCNPPGCV